MPNRRRRRLSTAASAVAALAVASPIAIIAVSQLAGEPAPAPQHREFVQAAVVTDLPNEIISALSQGLSQFGINMPPLPTGLSPAGTQPVTGTLTNPLAPGGLTSPALNTPSLSTPGVTSAAPALTDPALANPALTNPALTSPALTNPALTSPATPGLATPSLATPATGLNPALTSPAGVAPTVPGIGLPTEQPISAPIGLDPMAGTYPILGDPSLAAPASTGGGGLLSSLTGAAQQLGVGQAIDLLKGVVMPSITSAMQSAPAAAAAAAPAAAAPAG